MLDNLGFQLLGWGYPNHGVSDKDVKSYALKMKAVTGGTADKMIDILGEVFLVFSFA